MITPEDSEAHWRRHVFRGHGVPQLTPRAMVMGAALGGLTGVANLYIGLKIPWALGVVVTASVVGWAAWRALWRAGLSGAPTILETNAMASMASSAGYATGANLGAGIAAYAMVAGHHLPFWQLSIWTMTVAGLGLCLAIPVKRQLVNRERLPFPTGAAAAETLKALHGEGDGDDPAEPARRARALFWALGFGAILKWATEGMAALGAASGVSWIGALALPEALPTETMVQALPWLGTMVAYSFALELSGLLVAAGALVGPRIALSIGAGSVLAFAWVAPWAVGAGLIAEPSYGQIAQLTLWAGVPALVTAGLVALSWQGIATWRGRAHRVATPTADPVAAIEVPRSWFWIGATGTGFVAIGLQWWLFGIPPHLGLLAVVLAGVLAVVAARVTGQTDITPAGPLGKVAQLGLAATMPGQQIPNLMAASVSAGAATSCADLLTDLKAGHLLGADPRQQFWAQVMGAGIGTVCVVPVFLFILVPDPSWLGTPRWPAPAATVWAQVANLLSQGWSALPAGATGLAVVGAAVAVVLAVADQWAGNHRKWWPSATGLALGFILPASNGVSFVIGGGLAWWLVRRHPQWAKRRLVTLCAGVIAGESLVGVLAAALRVLS